MVRVLTIAGSDSGGGAGIQADLKTFQVLGCYGMSAITVLTAQNTVTVSSLFPSSPAFVADQISAVLNDIGVDAVKIGMVFSTDIIGAVARFEFKNVVLDPVMVAKGGSRLLEPDAINCLKEVLLPKASIVTPNIPEAEILTGRKIRSREDMKNAAEELLEKVHCVVVKGGHLENSSSSPDFFITRDGKRTWIEYPRIETRNTHGTGCTFSAAITAFLARGHSHEDSVLRAREFLQKALVSGAKRNMGSGHGPVNHNWAMEEK